MTRVNRIKKLRTAAYNRQQGRCYYCSIIMCQGDYDDFASRHGITRRQAMHVQCTAEHLIARQDCGPDSHENVVAACRHCNHLRHQRKAPLAPEPYRALVARRIADSRWHTKDLHLLIESIPDGAKQGRQVTNSLAAVFQSVPG